MCYIRKYYNRVIYWSCKRIMMNYSKMQKKYYYEYFNVYDPKKENTMETKE